MAILKKQHACADHLGTYYNRHLRDAFIEDLVFFDVDPRQYAPCIVLISCIHVASD